MDLFKASSPRIFSTTASLEKIYPLNISYIDRESYAIDLKSLLNRCYHGKNLEEKKVVVFPCSSDDGKEGILSATCRIKYKDVPTGDAALPPEEIS